jgi:CheY-like chemotaxis protein
VKALVVEDNPVDTKLLRALMESAGCQVITYPSAIGALEQIIAQQPDVVLVDLNLPGSDGLELVRAIRAHQDTNALPVLAMTAYPHRYDRRQAFDAGCSAWIIKPLNTRNFLAQLNTVCAKHNPSERK